MLPTTLKLSSTDLAHQRAEQAAPNLSGSLPRYLDLTLSETLVLGLPKQGIKTFFAMFGHGSTEVGEVLLGRKGR